MHLARSVRSVSLAPWIAFALLGCSSKAAVSAGGDGAEGRVPSSVEDGAITSDAASHSDSAVDAHADSPAVDAPVHSDATADTWTAPDTGSPITPGDAGTVDITFDIDSSTGVHAISPYIYGVNVGSEAADAHASIVRVGGNRLTAHNWENNASNAGSDYECESDDFLCSTETCLPNNDAPGAFIKAVVDQASAAGAATLVTVPIVDYVAADKNITGDIRATGSDYLSVHFKQNKATKGSAFSDPPDGTDAYVYQDEFVNWISTHEPSATLRFLLDNEPDLWSGTHPEVHPVAVTYDELKTRSITYATAIKSVLPNAHVSGPVSYGWAGYVNLQGATDSAADGDFIEYYLDQMKAAEASAGKRLVDDLDLHWYPEATGDGQRIVTQTSTPGLIAAREQAPRSLWDTSYVETSWITADSTGGAAIQLVPRMMGKISGHYPGTGLSFSEWNYGGGGDISGTIASADVLGVFGSYGVDMAMFWPGGADDSYAYAAFKAFRSYDGKGAAFGDTSIQATTSDVPDSSVYASLQSADVSKLTVVAINKADVDKVAGIVIHHSTTYTKASVYTVTASGGASLVASPSIDATATNVFRYTMPAQSVSVIVPTP